MRFRVGFRVFLFAKFFPSTQRPIRRHGRWMNTLSTTDHTHFSDLWWLYVGEGFYQHSTVMDDINAPRSTNHGHTNTVVRRRRVLVVQWYSTTYSTYLAHSTTACLMCSLCPMYVYYTRVYTLEAIDVPRTCVHSIIHSSSQYKSKHWSSVPSSVRLWRWSYRCAM